MHALQQTSFAVRRPVATLMIFLSVMVFGFFSYRRLPLTLMPELNYPTITVRTEYPGAAPEEVENEVSRPIEEALGVISGLRRISSVSRAGVSDVVLEFLWGVDMTQATQDVLEKLDLVFLPSEAQRPLILRYDPNQDPIMELSLSGSSEKYEGESGLRRLRRLAEMQVKRALEQLPGIAAVRVRGGLEEQYDVLLDPISLQRVGLSPQWVINQLRQFNINLAGGTLEEGRSEYIVRTLNEFSSLEDIANTVLLVRTGQVVRVRDVARVIISQKDRHTITRVDGNESVQIEVYKEGDANIVRVAKTVALAIGPLETNRPTVGVRAGRLLTRQRVGLAQRLYEEEGAILRIVADRSRFIEASIRELRQTALTGALLAVAVLFLFLGDLRTTSIVGTSIPISLLISFAPLNLLHLTLNLMSLGGLALGVGMLVDNSIVVLESIYRCREEGDDLVSAAVRGTREVAGAVTASTLTTVAVFFPLVFVEGVAGQAFGDLAVAVVSSLTASLLVALYFIPMLASLHTASRSSNETKSYKLKLFRLYSPTRFLQWYSSSSSLTRLALLPWRIAVLIVGLILEIVGQLALALILLVMTPLIWTARSLFAWLVKLVLMPPARIMQKFVKTLQIYYPTVLGSCLLRPWLPIAVAIGLSLVSIWMAKELGTELLPEVHQGELTVEVNLPVGTPVEETAARLRPYEDKILKTMRELERLIVTYGYDPENVRRSDEGEHTAKFKFIIKPSRKPAQVEEQVLAKVRQLFSDLPDAELRVSRPFLFTTEAPLVVEIQTHDLTKLRRLSAELENLFKKLPQLDQVERTLRPGAPEVCIQYDKDLVTMYGLDLGQISQQVRDLVKGFEATRFNRIDRRIPIVVRLDKPFREKLEDVKNLVVNQGAAQPIPLHAVARLELTEGPSEIRRINGRRVALVRATVAPGYSLGQAAAAVAKVITSEISWPTDTTFVISGQQEEWERSKTSLYIALGLSLFLVYAIMASQFESILQPLIIMLSVPLAFIGSIIGLWLLHTPVSVVVFLGLILLAGIVVNNAIVLIDYTNKLRMRGLPLAEAVIEAGRVRLRPILMTVATTVLGLLPMACGLGEGAEIRRPMALTIMFGLVTSTLLTLVLVPTVYYHIESLFSKAGNSVTPSVRV